MKHIFLIFLITFMSCGDGDPAGSGERTGACVVQSQLGGDQCLSRTTQQSCDLKRNSITTTAWICGANCDGFNEFRGQIDFSDLDFDGCEQFNDEFERPGN